MVYWNERAYSCWYAGRTYEPRVRSYVNVMSSFSVKFSADAKVLSLLPLNIAIILSAWNASSVFESIRHKSKTFIAMLLRNDILSSKMNPIELNVMRMCSHRFPIYKLNQQKQFCPVQSGLNLSASNCRLLACILVKTKNIDKHSGDSWISIFSCSFVFSSTFTVRTAIS